MPIKHRIFVLTMIIAWAGCAQSEPPREDPAGATDGAEAVVYDNPPAVERMPLPEERRLTNLRQLTFEGENAEAYFSSDGERLIFQRTYAGQAECDQIFSMSAAGGPFRRLSNGLGRTTCAYFAPGETADGRIIYSSTHLGDSACPPPPDRSLGYVWALYDYDILGASADGSGAEPLFRSPAYDAEATVSPDGTTIVFTSSAGGDLDIYRMNADGTDVKQLTFEPGYDGGPFFSPDGSRIVYRASHPETPEEMADYQSLLADGLIRPGQLDVWVMNADGTGKTRVTDNGAANFAPYFHPSGQKIIFASNLNDDTGRGFDLFLVDLDGSNLEQVTFAEEFDAFPMFSPDGRHLVFGSNRHGSHEENTNIFIAEWVEDLP
ncbi:MAG: PD40 domain-containing protein [Gemmatimonadetes bacterium]|nr:PD40 domain-containing protein [Gemmatimonadota bacterium]